MNALLMWCVRLGMQRVTNGNKLNVTNETI